VSDIISGILLGYFGGVLLGIFNLKKLGTFGNGFFRSSLIP